MQRVRQTTCLRIAAVLIPLALPAVALPLYAIVPGILPVTQEAIPSPPADRTLIYVADQKGTLAPLAFEMGTTPMNLEAVAKSDKRSYIELAGANSATVISNLDPRFYIFWPDEPNPKPPLVVRLTEKRGARRVSAMAQKGFRGFAVDSNEIVKPHYRVLGRSDGMIFVEIRSREPLLHGEYAIIGSDLQRIATFRVGSASTGVSGKS